MTIADFAHGNRVDEDSLLSPGAIGHGRDLAEAFVPVVALLAGPPRGRQSADDEVDRVEPVHAGCGEYAAA